MEWKDYTLLLIWALLSMLVIYNTFRRAKKTAIHVDQYRWNREC